MKVEKEKERKRFELENLEKLIKIQKLAEEKAAFNENRKREHEDRKQLAKKEKDRAR